MHPNVPLQTLPMMLKENKTVAVWSELDCSCSFRSLSSSFILDILSSTILTEHLAGNSQDHDDPPVGELYQEAQLPVLGNVFHIPDLLQKKVEANVPSFHACRRLLSHQGTFSFFRVFKAFLTFAMAICPVQMSNGGLSVRSGGFSCGFSSTGSSPSCVAYSQNREPEPFHFSHDLACFTDLVH